jgi:hypothetical protein
MTPEVDDPVPMDLRMDLLVDGELPDFQREQLLRLLDREPALWRGLAVRFLQRQTEKETVRKLMAGGALLPKEVVPVKRPLIGYVGMRRFVATAAGLFIAAGSALVTLYVVRPAVATPGVLHTSLPVEATSADAPVSVSVNLIKADDNSRFIPAATNRSTRSSYVVQPDGRGGAIVIPVNTVKAPIY